MNTKRRSIIFFVNRAYFFRVGILFCCSIHFWSLFLFKVDRLSIDCVDRLSIDSVCFGYVVILILSFPILIARERRQHILLADRRESLYLFLALFYSTNFLWIKRHLWFFAVSLKRCNWTTYGWLNSHSTQSKWNPSSWKKNHFYFQQILYSFNLNNSCLLFEFHRRLNNKCMLTSFFNRPTDSKLFD